MKQKQIWGGGGVHASVLFLRDPTLNPPSIYLGEKVSAKEAQSCGLVLKLIPREQIMKETLKTAKKMVSCPKVTKQIQIRM